MSVDNADTSRAYHHGDLRRGLIEAAQRLLEAQGADALSLRAVAREAGVSPAAPYHHFKDKNELLDAVARRAIDAGCTVKMPVADMFWGDRYGIVVDPFGHSWSIATHIRDMTPEEMIAAGKAAMAEMASPDCMGKS